MKWVVTVFVFLLVLASFATALPSEDVQLTNYVNDYVGVLSEEETILLTTLAQSLQEKGAAEVAIVIVDSLEGQAIEDYALNIAHEKLGDSDEDNGLLLLLSVEDREYRAEVGYGLEGDLNDAKIGRLQRNHLVENFQAQNYGQGYIKLMTAIHQELLPEQELPETITPVQTNNENKYWYLNFWTIFFFILIIRGILSLIFSKSKKGKRNANDAFTAALFASMFMRGGGGFGGFGGGGFGGGGAGGRF